MAFIDDLKLHLRITTNALDVEVQDLMDAAELDLALSGVDPVKIVDTDPLIRRAITVYCKAHFGYDNPDHERLLKAYEMLKMHLTLAGDYRVGDAE